MGNHLQKLFKKQARIIMVGLDNAGKTTLLYKLKLDKTLTTIPTVGFNIEQVTYKKIIFDIWDLGGQARIRSLWKHYLHNTDAIIFVVDAADTKRIDEAAKELTSLLENKELDRAILLVLANKQDVPNAMTAQVVKTKLSLHKLKGRTWAIRKCSAVTGEGVEEAMDWLAQQFGVDVKNEDRKK